MGVFDVAFAVKMFEYMFKVDGIYYGLANRRDVLYLLVHGVRFAVEVVDVKTERSRERTAADRTVYIYILIIRSTV